MAKRVFFSFHYQDVIDFRANVVRNHWMTKPDREAAGFFDHSLWEAAKKTGKPTLKAMINSGLEGSSVTCVLIGSQTYSRPWVRYELLKSFRRLNSMFGVHINGIKDKNQQEKDHLGPNPFEYVGVTYSSDGQTGTLWEKANSEWIEYKEIGGSSNFSTDVAQQYRGKGFNLGQWYAVYKWNADNGYKKFSTWVG
jgi:hypothetical protein